MYFEVHTSERFLWDSTSIASRWETEVFYRLSIRVYVQDQWEGNPSSHTRTGACEKESYSQPSIFHLAWRSTAPANWFVILNQASSRPRVV